MGLECYLFLNWWFSFDLIYHITTKMLGLLSLGMALKKIRTEFNNYLEFSISPMLSWRRYSQEKCLAINFRKLKVLY